VHKQNISKKNKVKHAYVVKHRNSVKLVTIITKEEHNNTCLSIWLLVHVTEEPPVLQHHKIHIRNMTCIY